jgi:GNAT superfamily N-acetyltransferase
VDELERIALAAYRPVYGPDAIDVAGATCLRAPYAPDSPMLNRVVGLGVDRPVAEAELDEALGTMDDSTFYVGVSPSSDPALDRLLEARGLEEGWGWMLFERAPLPVPAVRTPLALGEVTNDDADEWAAVVTAGYGLPEESATRLAAAPGSGGWTAFLARDGDEPAAAAAVWVDPPAAYFGFAATLPEHRGKGAQGALFAARIERALALGCTTLVTETGELRDGSPSSSYRNILRFGFEPRHVVANRLHRRPGPGESSS